MLEEKLIKIMQTHENLIRDMEIVQQLNLPNWYIAAGYVRNYIRDYLHGNTTRTALNDVDVIYYDINDLSIEAELNFEIELKNKVPENNWSIKNQARMHLRNHEQPYESVADAMMRWPETATAVGLSIDRFKRLQVIAPHGLSDLFNLVIRRSPYFKDKSYFRERITSKKWTEIWPKLKVIED